MSERTELQREILVNAYDNPNLSQVEVADRVGCSASYVSSVLSEYNSNDAMQARIEQLGGRGGMSRDFGGLSGNTNADGLDQVNIEDIPPIGIAATGAVVAVFLLSYDRVMASQPTLRWSFVLVGASIPVIIAGLFYRKYSTEGIPAATNWLFDRESTNSNSPSKNTREKTPPAPQTLKDDLYFDRADKQCEWCDTRIDSPDVHHLTPRSEGGANELNNLVVLCPNCHRKADRGIISQSKLRRAISQ
jgi:hypothetical protein